MFSSSIQNYNSDPNHQQYLHQNSLLIQQQQQQTATSSTSSSSSITQQNILDSSQQQQHSSSHIYVNTQGIPNIKGKWDNLRNEIISTSY